MTMHMLPSYYTTTSTKKRKQKNKSKSLIAAEKEHQKFLAKMGVGKSRGRSSVGRAPALQAGGQEFDSPRLHQSSKPTWNSSMAKKESNKYSGERKLLGIATMHKSNMVPVFSKDDAEEIAKMRRG